MKPMSRSVKSVLIVAFCLSVGARIRPLRVHDPVSSLSFFQDDSASSFHPQADLAAPAVAVEISAEQVPTHDEASATRQASASIAGALNPNGARIGGISINGVRIVALTHVDDPVTLSWTTTARIGGLFLSGPIDRNAVTSPVKNVLAIGIGAASSTRIGGISIDMGRGDSKELISSVVNSGATAVSSAYSARFTGIDIDSWRNDDSALFYIDAPVTLSWTTMTALTAGSYAIDLFVDLSTVQSSRAPDLIWPDPSPRPVAVVDITVNMPPQMPRGEPTTVVVLLTPRRSNPTRDRDLFKNPRSTLPVFSRAVDVALLADPNLLDIVAIDNGIHTLLEGREFHFIITPRKTGRADLYARVTTQIQSSSALPYPATMKAGVIVIPEETLREVWGYASEISKTINPLFATVLSVVSILMTLGFVPKVRRKAKRIAGFGPRN
jgi:hypothetical protein